MSFTYCKYHPEHVATWQCKKCDVSFCMDCVPEDEKNNTPRCTLCRSSLRPLGISGAITPFWFKLGHFFIYPMATPLLVVCLILATLNYIFVDPAQVTLIQIPIMLFSGAFVTKIAFSIMEYTAYGNLDSPNWKKMMSTENGWMFLKILAIAIILVVTILKLIDFSTILAIVVGLFFFFAYPAMNIILCMNKSLWSALNPARIIFVMSATGGGYWILFALIILFSMTSSYGSTLLSEQLSPSLGLPMAVFFSTYISFATYHMFGYVIYQYHFELDFSVDRNTLIKNVKSHGKQANDAIEKKAAVSKSGGLTEAEIFIQEGRYDDAEAILIELIRTDEDDQDAYNRLYRLCILQQKVKLITKVAEKHLTRLSTTRSGNLMRMAYLQVIELVPSFVPSKPEVNHQLIKVLNRKEDVKLALMLLNNLKKHHTDYPGLAEACFSFAKFLVEKLNKRAEAGNIIRWGINVAPDELKANMQNYLKLL